MFSDSMGVDVLCKKNHLFYDKQIFVENKTPLTDLVPVQKQITQAKKVTNPWLKLTKTVREKTYKMIYPFVTGFVAPSATRKLTLPSQDGCYCTEIMLNLKIAR